jgi:hypothetical protein
LRERNGFPVFPVEPVDAKFGLDDIRAALDAEDLAMGEDFIGPASTSR